jgi:hypothetical protein
VDRSARERPGSEDGHEQQQTKDVTVAEPVVYTTTEPRLHRAGDDYTAAPT